MADKSKLTEGKKEGHKIINLILSRYFNLIVLIIILIVFAAAYFYLINPKRQKILEAREKILFEKTAQKEKLQNIFTRIEKYQADYKNISDNDKQKINKIFINGLDDENYEQEKLFSLFESLINSQGLVLKSININDLSRDQKDKSANGGGWPAEIGKVAISLEVSGVNYQSFKNLLEKIEKNLMIMDIDDLSFSPESNSADLKITSYYYKQ